MTPSRDVGTGPGTLVSGGLGSSEDAPSLSSGRRVRSWNRHCLSSRQRTGHRTQVERRREALVGYFIHVTNVLTPQVPYLGPAHPPLYGR